MITEKTTYLVVSGPPCSGKTTVGRWIADHFQLPFFQRDVITELLFRNLGWKQSREWKKRLSGAAYEKLYHFMKLQFERRKSFIVESTFRPSTDTRRIAGLQRRYRFVPVQVHCTADVETLVRRFRDRAQRRLRHPGFLDREKDFQRFRRRVRRGMYDPLPIGGSLVLLDSTTPESVNRRRLLRQLGALLRSVKGAALK